ncbi:hypothetical protein BZG36_02509 [Bifiguratus adelaidae]|uniref:Ras-GEF domain-containing protein n=1 Tax=Bifiguratus adelaidae TaxID=1938954 RepID=A0A261Y2P8_9FUNG|nr:hypothetical protein BZG36_02509 [Bifiguratus adelaidae]
MFNPKVGAEEVRNGPGNVDRRRGAPNQRKLLTQHKLNKSSSAENLRSTSIRLGMPPEGQGNGDRIAEYPTSNSSLTRINSVFSSADGASIRLPTRQSRTDRPSVGQLEIRPPTLHRKQLPRLVRQASKELSMASTESYGSIKSSASNLWITKDSNGYPIFRHHIQATRNNNNTLRDRRYPIPAPIAPRYDPSKLNHEFSDAESTDTESVYDAKTGHARRALQSQGYLTTKVRTSQGNQPRMLNDLDNGHLDYLPNEHHGAVKPKPLMNAVVTASSMRILNHFLFSIAGCRISEASQGGKRIHELPMEPVLETTSQGDAFVELQSVEADLFNRADATGKHTFPFVCPRQSVQAAVICYDPEDVASLGYLPDVLSTFAKHALPTVLIAVQQGQDTQPVSPPASPVSPTPVASQPDADAHHDNDQSMGNLPEGRRTDLGAKIALLFDVHTYTIHTRNVLHARKLLRTLFYDMIRNLPSRIPRLPLSTANEHAPQSGTIKRRSLVSSATNRRNSTGSIFAKKQRSQMPTWSLDDLPAGQHSCSVENDEYSNADLECFSPSLPLASPADTLDSMSVQTGKGHSAYAYPFPFLNRTHIQPMLALPSTHILKKEELKSYLEQMREEVKEHLHREEQERQNKGSLGRIISVGGENDEERQGSFQIQRHANGLVVKPGDPKSVPVYIDVSKGLDTLSIGSSSGSHKSESSGRLGAEYRTLHSRASSADDQFWKPFWDYDIARTHRRSDDSSLKFKADEALVEPMQPYESHKGSSSRRGSKTSFQAQRFDLSKSRRYNDPSTISSLEDNDPVNAGINHIRLKASQSFDTSNLFKQYGADPKFPKSVTQYGQLAAAQVANTILKDHRHDYFTALPTAALPIPQPTAYSPDHQNEKTLVSVGVQSSPVNSPPINTTVRHNTLSSKPLPPLPPPSPSSIRLRGRRPSYPKTNKVTTMELAQHLAQERLFTNRSQPDLLLPPRLPMSRKLLAELESLHIPYIDANEATRFDKPNWPPKVQESVAKSDVPEPDPTRRLYTREELTLPGVPLPILLDRLISDNDDVFQNTFLIFYRRLMQPRQLLDALIKKFDLKGTMEETEAVSVQIAVHRVLVEWSKHHWSDFCHPQTRARLIEFWEALGQRPHLRDMTEELRPLVNRKPAAHDQDTEWSMYDIDEDTGDVLSPSMDNFTVAKGRARSTSSDVHVDDDVPHKAAPSQSVTTSHSPFDVALANAANEVIRARQRALSTSSIAEPFDLAAFNYSSVHSNSLTDLNKMPSPSRSTSTPLKSAEHRASSYYGSEAKPAKLLHKTSRAKKTREPSITGILVSNPLLSSLGLRLSSESTDDDKQREDDYQLLIERSIEELAGQLCWIEWQIFRDIEPRDLLRHIWSKAQKPHSMYSPMAIATFDTIDRNLTQSATDIVPKSSRIALSISHFNHLSSWATTVVLTEAKSNRRVRIMERLMELSKVLRDMNNYNSLMAILAGINCVSVLRLKHTRNQVASTTLAQFEALERLMSPLRSFRAYRQAVDTSKPPGIPYLGVHFQDLLSLAEANKDFRLDGSVHWQKFKLMGECIDGMMRFQIKGYDVVPDPQIIKVIMSRDVYTEEEAYARSLELEPRLKSSASNNMLRDLLNRATTTVG